MAKNAGQRLEDHPMVQILFWLGAAIAGLAAILKLLSVAVDML